MRRKILLIGKDGQLGWELQRALVLLGELRAVGRHEADLGAPESLRACIRAFQPDIIVNAGAYTAVDKAESEAELAHRVNALGPGVLAEAAQKCGAWLVHYSTDYVFDGCKDGAWIESDPTNPLSVYGRSKCLGEEAIRSSGARHLILRTSWVFAARGGNFVKTMLRLAKEREVLEVVSDQIGAPTGAELLADATALALQRIALAGPDTGHFAGTFHLSAAGSTSWHAYAQHAIAQAQAHGAQLLAGPEQVLPIPASAYPAPAARPANSRLDCSKFSNRFGISLPDWRYHVNRLIAELADQGKL